jgi:putative ABC transport system permease protein
VNVQVLAWTAFVAVATTLLFALAPAWKASRADIRATSGQTRFHRLGKALVVFEVMLSLELPAGAGLLIESVARFSSVPLGFAPAGLLTMSIALPQSSYPTEVKRLAFLERAGTSLGSLRFAFSTVLPLRGIPGVSVLSVEGRPDPPPDKAAYSVGENSVSPSYFHVMGIPLLRGRGFEVLDDSRGEPVAIVNATLVRQFFGNEDPLGKRIRAMGNDNPWLRIAGIVADEKRSNI